MRNPYLKTKYKIELFIPTLKFIHSFSTRIYFSHTEISQNTINRFSDILQVLNGNFQN